MEWFRRYSITNRREELVLLLTEAEADRLVAEGHQEIPPKPGTTVEPEYTTVLGGPEEGAVSYVDVPSPEEPSSPPWWLVPVGIAVFGVVFIGAWVLLVLCGDVPR